jgi:phosphoadenosine phosphosulfate reductase
MSAVAPALPDLDGAPAAEILGWALAAFSPRLAVACSMQDAVVVDLAVRLDPAVEVFFLDTGFHFAETYRTAARLKRRYGLNLVRLVPDRRAAVSDRDGTDACCTARKVAPMAAHDLIVNPLLGQGYDSVGCAPCTLPGRGRDGRWAGTGKTECGLHAGPDSLSASRL